MKNRFIYILALTLALGISSCNKWLEINPRTEVPVKDMFETEMGFRDAMTACYIKLADTKLYGKSLTMTDIEYLAQHWYTDKMSEESKEFKAFKYTSVSSEKLLKDIYGSLYNVIVQANLVLDNLETKGHNISDDKIRNVIKGEMLAVRAFCHLDILRLFGQMPNGIGKNVSLAYAETVSIKGMPFYPYSQFAKKIETDLNSAEILLKNSDVVFDYDFFQLNELKKGNETIDLDNFYQYRRFRFNYYAVKALQARFYNYIGDKSNARNAAMAVIEAKLNTGEKFISLAGDGDFNTMAFSLPSECIFAIHDQKIADKIKGLFQGQFATHIITKKEKEQELFKGYPSINNRYSFVWGIIKDNQGNERYSLNKYFQPPQGHDFFHSILTQTQFIPILRLSEMYLILMESSTTVEDFNKTYKEYMLARNQQVSGIADLSEVKNIILSEYRIEFYGEGQMFYTYKRLGEKAMLWKTDKEVGENEYVAPLPKTEYDTNK